MHDDGLEDVFRFGDELGPEQIVHIHEPSTGLKAIVVVDNIAAGPSIGGLRMAVDVSLEECVRLARAMTLKNAAASLPHGGGKSVIFADPRMPVESKEQLIRAFAFAIRDLSGYIVGPDMGTDERCMAWVRNENGRAVGLPREVGGIPLDEIGATGFGLSVAVDVAKTFAKLELQGARVAIQGFGSVGKHAARFLVDREAVLVAAGDSKGTLHDPNGIDVARLIEVKEGGGSVLDYGKGEKLVRDAIVDIDCEIWIPAARPDVLRVDNVGRLKAKLVAEGANIPVTPEAEIELHKRGVLVIPDFIANAGGVICGAIEYASGTQAAALQTIEEKIHHNTAAVLTAATDQQVPPRAAAIGLAVRRVRRAMTYRRWS